MLIEGIAFALVHSIFSLARLRRCAKATSSAFHANLRHGRHKSKSLYEGLSTYSHWFWLCNLAAGRCAVTLFCNVK